MTRRAAAFAAAGVLLALARRARRRAPGPGRRAAARRLGAIFDRGDSLNDALVLDIRLPRAAAGVIAGGALAAAAVVLQAITRNPLAEPATLGLTAGGALAVTLVAAYALARAGRADDRGRVRGRRRAARC